MQKLKTNKNHTSHLAHHILKNNKCTNHVGVGVPDDPQNVGANCVRHNSNGITLIALVITIIVMLILVGVTITVAINGGLIDKTKEAADKTKLEADRETLTAAVIAAMNNQGIVEKASDIANHLSADWEVSGEDLGPYTAKSPNLNVFTVESNGKVTTEGQQEPSDPEDPDIPIEDLALIQKYFSGKNLFELVDINTEVFKDDPDSITDASTSLKAIAGTDIGIGTDEYMYIKYKNAVYRIDYIITDYNEETETIYSNIKSIEFEYKPQGREGQTIEYSYDGTEANKKEWTIIYDDGTYIEIASPEAMGEFTVGYNDSQAVGTNKEEKIIDSYNNLVTRMNSYCASLITNEDKVLVRSIGSNPENSNDDDIPYVTEESLGEYSGLIKDKDEKFLSDKMRVNFFDVGEIMGQYDYLFAYRYYTSELDNSSLTFSVYHYDYSSPIFEIKEGGIFSEINNGSNSGAVRPIVKLYRPTSN